MAEPNPTAEPITRAADTHLSIAGMTCGNCARHVTDALQSVTGVRSATVNLDSQQAHVRWADSAPHDNSDLLQAVQAAGYGAKVVENKVSDHGEHQLAGWQLNLWIGILGTIPLMLGEWVFGWGPKPWFQWFSFGLAAVVQIVAGAPFYGGAWNQLKAGHSNMDALVALGSTTAFAYSVWALFKNPGSHLYFMEAAAIITLISLGHWLESRLSVRASTTLRQLLNLSPERARRRNPDGSETQVPAATLQINDLISVRPGDRVPTDGQILEGASDVDESALTGESASVEKHPKSLVYGGTLNLNGLLLVRVTATGDETALAHVIAAVQRAQSSRAQIQRLGDRVSSVFVPLVVLVALAAGLWWGLAPEAAHRTHEWLAQFLWSAHPPVGAAAAGIMIASAVLIIACPCAMGLATPVAIMAGSNAAAQRGILIRDGVALEKAGRITSVLFDKTGTLTSGRPQVVNVWEHASGNNKIGAAGPLTVAASLARVSTHPVSKAVADFVGDSSSTIALENVEELRGSGVKGTISGGPSAQFANNASGNNPGLVRLGSLNWLQASGVDISPGKTFADESFTQGATVVGVTFDETLLALFAIKDVLKPGARSVVDQLQQQHLKTYLITGDNPTAARTVARDAGIPEQNVFAEVRPEQKSNFVKQLQERGERVAFVGDGINDAPALEQADLGIAVSRASDIAREAADIILLNSEIHAVPESLGLARATLRTIKQNLFWAFFYNAIGVPLAALGFMSPILCAAAMGLSDMVVIGNALRLRRWRAR